MELGKWRYHSSYKWWEYSIGTGTYVVQRTRIGWVVMKVPFMGNPMVLGRPHADKRTAQKAAERFAK